MNGSKKDATGIKGVFFFQSLIFLSWTILSAYDGVVCVSVEIRHKHASFNNSFYWGT